MRHSRFTAVFLAATFLSTTLCMPAKAFLMWKAERNDTVIHVLAKVDFLSPNEKELIAAKITSAFDESDVAVFESQMEPEQRKRERQKIVLSAFYPKSDNLIRHLPHDIVQSFNAFCEANQVNNAGIVRVMPWAASYNLNRIAIKKAGVEQIDFLDKYFFKLAGTSGKAADYLTKSGEAIALFKNLPASTQIDMFKKAVHEAMQKKTTITQAADAWKSGAAEAAEALVNKAYKAFGSVRESVNAKLSENWAAKLNSMTRFDDNIFVIVPLENTVGTASVLEKLKADGFTVTQVE